MYQTIAHSYAFFQIFRAEDKVELLTKIDTANSVLNDVVTHAAMQEIPDLMKKVRMYIISTANHLIEVEQI